MTKLHYVFKLCMISFNIELKISIKTNKNVNKYSDFSVTWLTIYKNFFFLILILSFKNWTSYEYFSTKSNFREFCIYCQYFHFSHI